MSFFFLPRLKQNVTLFPLHRNTSANFKALLCVSVLHFSTSLTCSKTPQQGRSELTPVAFYFCKKIFLLIFLFICCFCFCCLVSMLWHTCLFNAPVTQVDHPDSPAKLFTTSWALKCHHLLWWRWWWWWWKRFYIISGPTNDLIAGDWDGLNSSLYSCSWSHFLCQLDTTHSISK